METPEKIRKCLHFHADSKTSHVSNIFRNTWKKYIPEKNMGKIPLESPPSNLPNLRKAAEDLQGNSNAGHGAGSPSLPASTESRTPATSRSPRSPNDRRRDSNNDQELPGIKPVPRICSLWFFSRGSKLGYYGLGSFLVKWIEGWGSDCVFYWLYTWISLRLAGFLMIGWRLNGESWELGC